MRKAKYILEKATLWFVTICCALLPTLHTLPVKADSPSLWIGGADPTFSVDHDPAQPVSRPINEFCTDTPFTVTTTANNAPPYQTAQECATDTDFGTLSRHFLRYGSSSLALRLELVNGLGSPVLVPHSSQLFYTVLSGGQQYLDSYASPISKLKKLPGNSSWPYMYKTGGPTDPDWQLTDQSNNAIVTHSIAASKNGRWMVVETSTGLVRVDLVSKQLVKFTTNLPPYGSGSNPTIHLAISNDGRYVAVSGLAYNNLRIYDLSTCSTPSSVRDTTLMSGCGEKILKPFLNSALPGYVTSLYLEFNGDATALSMRLTAPGKAVDATITAAGQSVSKLDYLALGDSFSSGEGDTQGHQYYEPGTDGDASPTPGINTGVEKCHISKRSYPYLLAQQMGITSSKFRNLACSGAKLEDMGNESDYPVLQKGYRGQFEQIPESIGNDSVKEIKQEALNSFIAGRANQLAFVEKYKPKIITISIGGNDVGFTSKITACTTNAPLNAVCDHASSEAQRAQDANEYAKMFVPLRKLYQEIHERSKDSKIFVVGYPSFVGSQELCSQPNVGLNSSEREYVNESVSYFNDIIENAAKAAGVSYIDTEAALNGDRLCDGSGSSKAVNGITFGEELYGLFGQESFHPTQNGQARMASAITSSHNNLLTDDTCPQTADTTDAYCPGQSILPATPPYFQDTSGTPTLLQYLLKPLQFVALGQVINSIGVANFAPGSTATFELHSDPLQLGTTTTDANGNASTTLTIPEGAEPGYHTLHIYGIGPSGEQLDTYQPLLVLGQANDQDGDDIPDGSDPCPFIAPAGVDYDQDGTDDACDGFIGEPPDTAPPTVTGTADRIPNANGWYNQDVTISWNTNDPAPSSGAPTVPSGTLANQEGVITYTSDPSCDPSNNCSTGNITISLDKTAPSVGAPSWTNNPKPATATAALQVPVNDSVSGAERAEYFIGNTDPGQGNGTIMDIQAGNAVAIFGADLPPGTHDISIRTRDYAGNWSELITTHLTVDSQTSAPQIPQGLAKIKALVSSLVKAIKLYLTHWR